MAVESPPAWLQAGSYGAEQTRRTVASLLARGASIGSILGGLVGATDCQITAGSGMQISIAPGEVWVPGSTSATQSGYYCRVSSATTLSIATSDPSNPRIDRVSAVVTDAAYSGASNTFAVAVETGTPTGGATLTNLSGVATAPASSYTLGYVLVPAGSSSVTNGNISNASLPATLGLNAGLTGHANISTSQSTSSTTYTTLTTPDQVTGIVLPTNGLIAVWYQATWQGPASGTQNAAIFVGANQVVMQGFDGTTHGTNAQSALFPGATGAQPLFSFWGGLGSSASASATYNADVTTGQIIGYANTAGQVESAYGANTFTTSTNSTIFQAGGPCYIFAAAGTYTVSVQFKTSTGSVTASNRKLWVQALSFS